MPYIYHGVPEHMIGDILIPLSLMRTISPELHKGYLEKYKGREEMLQKKIPLLDCLWNDAVQFLPLNPQDVFEAQKELGIIKTVVAYRFFRIDLSTLDPSKTVVYYKTALGDENVTVKWLEDVNLAALQEIPKATLDYYKTFVGTSELPFNYQFIPHILYRGEVDISAANTITLE